jgi:hypothetical protein
MMQGSANAKIITRALAFLGLAEKLRSAFFFFFSFYGNKKGPKAVKHRERQTNLISSLFIITNTTEILPFHSLSYINFGGSGKKHVSLTS